MNIFRVAMWVMSLISAALVTAHVVMAIKMIRDRDWALTAFAAVFGVLGTCLTAITFSVATGQVLP